MKVEGHRDERGVLFWLDKATMDFNNITVGTINPNCKRGGHYHKIMSEKIMCISGILHLKLEDKMYVLEPGDIIDIPINCVHTLFNGFDKLGVFLELKDKNFSENKPDIHRRKK